MQGIYPNGRCPVEGCGKAFKMDRSKGLYVCPEHRRVQPRNFTVSIYYKGERIRRGTTLEGLPIRSIADANAVVVRAKGEIETGRFNVEKWRSTAKDAFHTGRLFLLWYQKKYHAMKQGELSPNYVKDIRSYYRNHFRPYAIKKEFKVITDIRSTADFFESRSAKLSAKYKKNLRAVLSSFFTWVKVEQRLIAELPYFPTFTPVKKAPEVLDIETRRAVLSFVKPVHRPIIGFFMVQGCRPGELIALKGDAIRADRRLGRIVEYKRAFSAGILVEHPKDKESRINPIMKEAEQFLPERLFANDYVFKHKSAPYTESILRHQLYWAFIRYNKHMRKEAEKIGGTWDDIKIPFYNFGKHSVSSEFYESGATLQDLQQWHGHSKAETSLIYTKIDVVKRFRSIENIINLANRKQAENE